MLKILLLGPRGKQEISSHEAEEPCWNKCFIRMMLPRPQAGSCARVWLPHPCAKGRGSPAAAPAPLPCCIPPGDAPNPFCSSLHPARHLDGEAAGFGFFHKKMWIHTASDCSFCGCAWLLKHGACRGSPRKIPCEMLWTFSSFSSCPFIVTWQKGKFGERGERHW